MLDPSIILGANVNAGEVAQKVQANLQQQQAAQQQLQLQQYGVAQAKQDFEDQQNLKAAWRQAGGDPDKTMAIASHLGVSPKTLQAYQMQQMQLKTQKATYDKTLTDTQKAKQDIDTANNDWLYEQGSPLTKLTDPTAFNQARNELLSKALDQGRIAPALAADLGKKSQQEFNDTVFHYRSLKSATAESTIDKNTAEADKAKQDILNDKTDGAIKDANLINVQKQQWADKLEAAYTSAGGGVKGTQAYDQLRSTAPPNIQPLLTASDEIGKITDTEAAKNAIRDIGKTGQQRTQDDLAAANAKRTADYQAQEIALRKQSNSFQQQALGLDAAKTQAALFAAGLDSSGRPIQGQGTDLLKTNTQNTSDGRLFIDQDEAFKALPKGQIAQVRQAAANAGVPLLSSKEAAAIKDADTARNQINAVYQTFMQNAGAGTSGLLLRPAQAIGNWAASASGLNPQLDAARKNFLTAIESLKSAGGAGSGLRITGAEITKVGPMQPALGDTQEILIEKARQFNQFLGDKIDKALHQVPVTAPKPSGPTGGVTITAPDGTPLSFPNQTAANAFKKAHNL